MNERFADGRRFHRWRERIACRGGRKTPGTMKSKSQELQREEYQMLKSLLGGIVAATAFVMLGSTAMADPEIVSGPAAEPECFAPWSADTKFFKFPAKPGPYRIALANGYIANTWRIQMIQTAKAYAAQPDVAAKLK